MATLRVLVIDDEERIRASVRRALKRFTVALPTDEPTTHRFEVLEADSGEAGLEAIAASRPDIVFLDLMLPGISGLDVLERLAREGRDLLTVLITAFATIETAVAATKRGAHDVLAKPFDVEDVRAVVRKAADHLLAKRQAARLARERHAIRDDLLRVVAHELNTPLTVIQGYLDLLGERSLGGDLEAYERPIESMRRRALGMRKLVRDLLELTALESGRRPRRPVRVELGPLAAEALEGLRALASEMDVTVELRVSGPAVVEADPRDLESVVTNLVTNAVKYNRPGGRVDVVVDGGNGDAVLAVSDTGIGVTEEHQTRIFDEFYRVRCPETVGVEGSGLGLSIVRRIVCACGGEIALTSRPGEGSTFTVSLPAAPAAAPAA